jgi:hypothetical protein
MRMLAFVVIAGLGSWSCTGENAGAEEAKRLADQEQKQKGPVEVPKSIQPPVPSRAKIPCDQLISDPAAYQTATGEKKPLTIKELTNEPDAAASCALIRGGKRPSTDAEQKAIVKETGYLGVLPGDALCEVAAFCWTLEESERFRRSCKEKKGTYREDESMGSFACVQVTAQGAADVNTYRFFDEDTKCILQVRGGPSNSDNASILACAKTARDQIGPAQIAVRK